MPLNPTIVENALVATPSPAGSAPFGPSGIGLVVRKFGVATFVKFIAQQGFTYVVSTNVLPGDLVLTGPNGGPLNPGDTAIKAFSFTPNQTGLYVIGMVPNPRFVVTGQEIDLSVQAVQANLPTTVQGALMVSKDPVGDALRIANGSAVQQYFLHAPDGNPLGVGAPAGAFDIEPSPPPPSLPMDDVPGDVETQNIGFSAATAAATTTTTVTPLFTANGKPVTWAGATDAPGQPGDPTQISVAIGTRNFQSDQGVAAPFSDPFPQTFVPLLNAAEDFWESLANVKFNNIADDATTRVSAADIRVGVSALSENETPNTMAFIGFTNFAWDANNKFLPDTVLTVDDPADRAVTPLADGDLQYSGLTTTVFQDFLHELGHAIGLAHNPDDPNSIMNPVLSPSNPFPDIEDFNAVQELYGPPNGSVQFSQNDINVLSHLISQA